MEAYSDTAHREPWNKGKIVGQKAPLRLKDIWAIRIRLQLGHRTRELAMFDLALDSKLRACDLVKLRFRDIAHGDHISAHAIVMQQKTSLPVQFEITQPTREAVSDWIMDAGLKSEDYLFPSRVHDSPHIGTRQYSRIVDGWINEIGLGPSA
jgi:integrase